MGEEHLGLVVHGDCAGFLQACAAYVEKSVGTRMV